MSSADRPFQSSAVRSLGRETADAKSWADLVDDFVMPDDDMYVNTMILRVYKEKELCFTTLSGAQHVGFCTGLDREWIQITTSEGLFLGLLNLVNVESIRETGNSVSDLPPALRDRVKVYTRTIHIKSKEIQRARRSQGAGQWASQDDE